MKKHFLVIQVSSLVVVLCFTPWNVRVQGNSLEGFCVCQRLIFKAGLMGPGYYSHSCCVSSFPELPQKSHKGDFRWDAAQWTGYHPSPQPHPYCHFLCLFTSRKAWMLIPMTVQVACLLWSLPYLGRVIPLSLIFL